MTPTHTGAPHPLPAVEHDPAGLVVLPTPGPTAPPVDLWTWVARLSDGRVITEEQAGTWLNVPADQVVAIEMIPTDASRSRFMLEIPPGAVPWFGRLRTLNARGDLTDQHYTPSLTIIRWTLADRAIWCYLLDDGTICVTDRELPRG